MAKVGRRAFTALSDLFRLPDNLSLGELDLRIASPVLDLQNIMQSSMARYSRFELTVSATAAANPNGVFCRPTTAGDWASILSTDGDGLAIPGEDTIQIMGASVFVATPGNFTDATLVQRKAVTFERLMLAHWDSIIDGMAERSAGEGHYGGFPFEAKTLSSWPFRFETNVSANTDVTFVLDILSGPRGLFGSVA